MEFSQILHLLLKNNAISNYTLSKNIGVSQSTIANWLNGISTPNFTKLLKIADYFNVSVDYLLGRTDAGTEINSNNTITGNYNVFGNNNSQISIKDELSSQEQELIARFRELSELDKAKTLLNVTEMCEKR